MSDSDFYVSVTEAFEWGRLMGQQEAFQDLAGLEFDDRAMVERYVHLRLQVLETAIGIVRAQQGG